MATESEHLPSVHDLASVPFIEGRENTEDKEKSCVEEYRYYLDKSQQLFAGLRELPHTGRNWQPYFQRTFEVYTRLWKHQQTHRITLERDYNLKRFEIGELASKIGQLYYHYYLRTSESSYLRESYTFYEAIHNRQYFKDVLETQQPTLMIRKLRYYAVLIFKYRGLLLFVCY
jgi:hypothetical protein